MAVAQQRRMFFFVFFLVRICTGGGKVEPPQTLLWLVDEDVRQAAEASRRLPVIRFPFFLFPLLPIPPRLPFAPVAAIIWLSDGGGLDRGPLATRAAIHQVSRRRRTIKPSAEARHAHIYHGK